MSKIPVSDNVDIEKLARATPGTSGADLANMVNEAALFAIRKNKEIVEMDDFEDARDKILMGVARKSLVIADEEKRATAIHESGHALLHYFLPNSDSLHKVTIVPRGRALGLALSLPDKDTYSRTYGWLYDRIVISYGGFAAEKIVYGHTTTGTAQDIKQATEIARKNGPRVGNGGGNRPHLPRRRRGAYIPRPRNRTAQGLLRADGTEDRRRCSDYSQLCAGKGDGYFKAREGSLAHARRQIDAGRDSRG